MNKFSVLIKSERQRLANLLRSCPENLSLNGGMQVHGAVYKTGFGSDLMLNNDLIGLYVKCKKLETARMVFDRMLEKNVVSWTALMSGYVQNGYAKRSLVLFSEMGLSGVMPNEFTLSTNLKAAGILGVIENGMQIHGLSVKAGFDWFNEVGNSVIDMYAKCGRVGEAERVFETNPVSNLISWNTLMAGYTQEENGEKALGLFRKMVEGGEVLDGYTFTSSLKACSLLGAIREGKQIHASLVRKGISYLAQATITGALIDLYVKCGCLGEARRVFDRIEMKNVISWSALILGYAQEENLQEAMDLFRQLRESTIQVDGFVLSGMMGVFSDFALVEQGKQIHAYAIKVPCGLETSVCNSIVDMYLKCGLTDEAEIFFNEMTKRNVVSWTVMITGYGKHGLGKEAVRLFGQMLSYGIMPDSVTYLAVLSACSHSGLRKEGQDYFSMLCNDPMVKPRVEHYSCMVDLLGRAGRLEEAKNLIKSMPLKPSIAIWQTLLSACRLHGNLEMGKEVGEIILRLDGNSPVNYVMMSNIYADAGYWKESERIRKMVKERGLIKEGGRSWVEIDKQFHIFYGGDDTHPLTHKIHEILKLMERRIKEEIGYMRGLRFALYDVEEESKEESLRFHSEKLAIGLALVCGGLDGERVIRVFKNLRVCGDCHEFIKSLSKILKVVFVVRDANRFHKFKDGQCSCEDYW